MSLGLISREYMILALVCDKNLFDFRNAKFSRRVSKISNVSSCLDAYFSWDIEAAGTGRNGI